MKKVTDEMVLYVEGKTNVITSIVNGRNLYGDETVEELQQRNRGAQLMPFEKAWEKIMKIHEEEYNKPWEEITEERWLWAFECLPPQAWDSCPEVEVFRMSEYLVSNYTDHFIRLGNRFFKATRKAVRMKKWKIYIDEVKKQFNL